LCWRNVQNGGRPEEIVKAKNLAQVSDEGLIQETIIKILNDNPRKYSNTWQGKSPFCSG
jgi:Asp-tRNA(Asn)/Glu-tRNA(Gln) amidotransferase B subunit